MQSVVVCGSASHTNVKTHMRERRVVKLGVMDTTSTQCRPLNKGQNMCTKNNSTAGSASNKNETRGKDKGNVPCAVQSEHQPWRLDSSPAQQHRNVNEYGYPGLAASAFPTLKASSSIDSTPSRRGSICSMMTLTAELLSNNHTTNTFNRVFLLQGLSVCVTMTVTTT